MPDRELPEEACLNIYEQASSHNCLDELQQGLHARYETLKVAGEGGAKKVLLARDRLTGRRLAKATPRDNRQSSQEEFIREARLHALLEHPNIIPLYDIGLEENQTFFTMKYVEGQTLQQWFQQVGAKQQQNALDIFLKVCDALAYAHSKNASPSLATSSQQSGACATSTWPGAFTRVRKPSTTCSPSSKARSLP